MSFAVCINLLFASILGLTLFRILGALGSIGTFGLYAGFNLVAWVLIFLFAPETKGECDGSLRCRSSSTVTLTPSLLPPLPGRTLEELDQVFSVPTRVFIRYQVTKTLPYWLKRYVLRQKSATIEPLYHVDSQMADSVVKGLK